MDLTVRTRRESGRDLPVLVGCLPVPMRAIASAPHGGGLGVRSWVVNAQVPASYGRSDPELHLADLAVSLGLAGAGVGMLTSADVRSYQTGSDLGVDVAVTVGLGHPVTAAAPDDGRPIPPVGTINVVAVVPERLTDAALVNAVGTVTEAKTQALADLGLRATGTATDAVCVFCPTDGRTSSFGGPRSAWGARLARAVHHAVLAGGRT